MLLLGHFSSYDYEFAHELALCYDEGELGFYLAGAALVLVSLLILCVTLTVCSSELFSLFF